MDADILISPTADIAARCRRWLDHLHVEYSADDRQRLLDALLYSAPKESDTPQTGDIVIRTLAVLDVLTGLRLDMDTLIAAALHGTVIQDAPAAIDTITRTFGADVAGLLKGLLRMRVIDEQHILHGADDSDRTQIESLRKLLLAMAEDMRVVFIRLAESLVTLRNLKTLSDVTRQRRIAEEIMEIDAPLANRLGIWQIKWELEDLCFRYLYPGDYQQIARLIDEKRIDRERYIEQVIEEIARLLAAAGIKAEISGRPKHIYSIWRKMQHKQLDFNELFDVRAVRILVDEVATCYAALGVVHSRWQPIRGEFDDYIASPKQNNYQSLHTAVIGPEGRPVEIQIRTIDMHRHSEYGMASHWRYKETRSPDATYSEKINWVRQMLEAQDEDATAGDFVDRFRSEVFQDRIYAITPAGKLVDLPRGATTLDFAYAIHTDIGHRYRGARVNGRMVPLAYELNNGERVEILTTKNGVPSRDWLNPHLGYLKTAAARGKVRAWFRLQDLDTNIRDGRNLLDRELRRLGMNDLNREQLARNLGFNTSDALAVALATGDLTIERVARDVKEHILQRRPGSQATAPRRTRRAIPGQGELEIMGVGGLMTRMALCCKPVPMEPIVGYITRGRGVTIHRRDCAAARSLYKREPERFLDVGWGREGGEYPVDIRIEAFDRPGLLSDITTLLSGEKLNVIRVNSHTDKATQVAIINLTVEVSDIDQLSRALMRIEQLRNIQQVSRTGS